MGLDMWLEDENGKELKYWRKANAIHNWFVQNCQDDKDECQKTQVSHEKLKELLDLCIKTMYDTKKANKYLPPQAGFFFGSQAIDMWYFRDLLETIDALDKILEDPYSPVVYYQSSW